MEKIIFISPHHDDAVFSCPGLIQRAVQKGKSVEIITVFSDTRETTHERREETRRACQVLGIQSVDWGMKDALVRHPTRDVLFADILAEDETLAELRHMMKTVLMEQPNTLFCIPLGVGWHIDHLLVFEAALEVFPQEKLFFYEDAPYREVPLQTRLRIKSDSQKQKEFVTHFLKAPYVEKYLPHWTETDVQALVSSPCAPSIERQLWFYTNVILQTHEVIQAQKAVAEYKSQSDFFPDLQKGNSRESYWVLSPNISTLLGGSFRNSKVLWR